MNTLEHLLFSRFKLHGSLALFLGVALLLLMIRIKITHSFFYLFLVWNLFLAVIPYGISLWLQSLKKPSKWFVILIALSWLAILPNAPYIITDFVHLRFATASLIWLDILLLFVFASNGLLFYFLTLQDMQRLLKHHFATQWISVISGFIPFLCGFGIYLGRVLRWNSWDLLHHPKSLLTDILSITLNPVEHLTAWGLTLGFGIFLFSGMLLFSQLGKLKKVNTEMRPTLDN
ncbi:MAG: DUF1361 domain-containing protein [Flavobacteriales bacterium]|jgi:uncharacterized membrane protein|uniref:DUF1361 domain-containing protein n=1 Tax=Candidatus Ulvibacter alkanivorans TaxID=2267620 RepID=UPI000DF25063|nr:DUF1361 domain-containing protein [Candidatus Ulvibacter alkanivorans]MCH2491024.1 DUF1361 domain-containing protein [Flavobacteriales bacterium]